MKLHYFTAIVVTLLLIRGLTGQNLQNSLEFLSDGGVYVSDIKEGPNNDVFTIGSFFGNTKFEQDNDSIVSSIGYESSFINCYDSSGSLKWMNLFGASGGKCIGQAIVVDDSNNVYACGVFEGSIDFDPAENEHILTAPDYSQSVFFAKYDSAGNLKWAHCFSGGTNAQFIEDISIDSESNIYLCGLYQGNVDFDPGTAEVSYPDYNGSFIAKYSRNGDFLKIIDINIRKVYRVVPTEGSLYVFGEFYERQTINAINDTSFTITSKGDRDFFIGKLNENDKAIWACSVGGSQADIAGDIALHNNELVVMCNYDQNIEIEDTIMYSTSIEILLAKLNADNGELIWAKSVGGNDQDIGVDLEIDNSGNIYMTGEFYGNPDFDPGIGEKLLSYKGLSDIFLAKYDIDGNYVWAEGIGNSAFNYGVKVESIHNNSIALAGKSSNSTDIDFTDSVYTIGSGTSAPFSFVAWYDMEPENPDTSSTHENRNIVKDINTGGSSHPQFLMDFENTLYFVANNGDAGIEVWKSDGSDSGTVMLKDINPYGNGIMTTNDPSKAINPRFTKLNGELFFIATDSTNNFELWKTDGSSSNTIKVKEINQTGSAFTKHTRFETDSSSIYFKATVGDKMHLFISDGTEGNTRSIHFFGKIPVSENYEIVNSNNKIFFTHEYKLFLVQDDGRVGLIKEFNSYPQNLVPINGSLVFSADGGNGIELWKSNGTLETTSRIADIVPGAGSSMPANFYKNDSIIYFTARNYQVGNELWITNGTEEGTRKVKDITDNNNPVFNACYASTDSLVYFYSVDSLNSSYLWRTNGTQDGTYVLKNLNEDGTGIPGNFIVYNNLLFFCHQKKNGFELLRTLELDTLMVPLNGINEITFGYPQNLTISNNRLFFTAVDNELGDELWTYNFVTGIKVEPVDDFEGMLSKDRLKSNTQPLHYKLVVSPAYATDPILNYVFKQSQDLVSINSEGIITLNELTSSDTVKIIVKSNDGSTITKELIFTNVATNSSKSELLKVEEEVFIYPNPFINKFYLKSDLFMKGEALINIYSVNGSLLISQETSFSMNDEIEMVLIDMDPGLYFIQITTDNTVICKRIIKK